MNKLAKLVDEARAEIALARTEQDINWIKAKYLGKKSELTMILKSIKDLPGSEKIVTGRLANNCKNQIKELLECGRSALAKRKLNIDHSFDYTLPVSRSLGSLHPITIVAKEVTEIMKYMGFMVVDGPEMEDDYHNFAALNYPEHHPARDMQDTYWLDNGQLLRTQTSACQVRALEKYGAPLRIISPGRCFRNEDVDASHENTFFQLEGMYIDKNVSIPNLIYVMKQLLSEVLARKVKVRLRPGYFPFVEPGFELDINCTICGGAGCKTCKYSGWLELLPCGMVHPNVLTLSGIDSYQYNGFAFGLGLTRLAMMKYQIGDIRVFNSASLDRLEQFNIKTAKNSCFKPITGSLLSKSKQASLINE